MFLCLGTAHLLPAAIVSAGARMGDASVRRLCRMLLRLAMAALLAGEQPDRMG